MYSEKPEVSTTWYSTSIEYPNIINVQNVASKEKVVDEVNDPSEPPKGLSLLAHIILNQEFNTAGHSDLVVSTADINIHRQLQPLMKELDDYAVDKSLPWWTEIKYSEDGIDLYLSQYWEDIEDSPTGRHHDKLVLSWERIVSGNT